MPLSMLLKISYTRYRVCIVTTSSLIAIMLAFITFPASKFCLTLDYQEQVLICRVFWRENVQNIESYLAYHSKHSNPNLRDNLNARNFSAICEHGNDALSHHEDKFTKKFSRSNYHANFGCVCSKSIHFSFILYIT